MEVLKSRKLDSSLGPSTGLRRRPMHGIWRPPRPIRCRKTRHHETPNHAHDEVEMAPMRHVDDVALADFADKGGVGRDVGSLPRCLNKYVSQTLKQSD